MSQNDSNNEVELDEVVENEEEVKSGLKIRTNLKAGALSLAGPRPTTGKGITTDSLVEIGPQFDPGALAGIGNLGTTTKF